MTEKTTSNLVGNDCLDDGFWMPSHSEYHLRLDLKSFKRNIDSLPMSEVDHNDFNFLLSILPDIHKGQVRENGCDYLTYHILPVAYLVAEIPDIDPLVIKAALLHDTFEDQPVNFARTILNSEDYGYFPELAPDTSISTIYERMVNFLLERYGFDEKSLKTSYAVDEEGIAGLGIEYTGFRFAGEVQNSDEMQERYQKLTSILKSITKPHQHASETKSQRDQRYSEQLIESKYSRDVMQIKVSDMYSNCLTSITERPHEASTKKYMQKIFSVMECIRQKLNRKSHLTSAYHYTRLNNLHNNYFRYN